GGGGNRRARGSCRLPLRRGAMGGSARPLARQGRPPPPRQRRHRRHQRAPRPRLARLGRRLSARFRQRLRAGRRRPPRRPGRLVGRRRRGRRRDRPLLVAHDRLHGRQGDGHRRRSGGRHVPVGAARLPADAPGRGVDALRLPGLGGRQHRRQRHRRAPRRARSGRVERPPCHRRHDGDHRRQAHRQHPPHPVRHRAPVRRAGGRL
ncbi:MAG: Acyl-phosphate:glycerol-3-phosphate O-acyltransferase PlsY (EC, partial [uncultured Thermomicrobiales bacterium]